MTPRSRRYFASKKYGDSMLVKLMPIFEAYKLRMDAMIKLATPICKRPPETESPRQSAIIGEIGPELVQMPNGQFIMTHSKLRRIELPANHLIIPESKT